MLLHQNIPSRLSFFSFHGCQSFALTRVPPEIPDTKNCCSSSLCSGDGIQNCILVMEIRLLGISEFGMNPSIILSRKKEDSPAASFSNPNNRNRKNSKKSNKYVCIGTCIRPTNFKPRATNPERFWHTSNGHVVILDGTFRDTSHRARWKLINKIGRSPAYVTCIEIFLVVDDACVFVDGYHFSFNDFQILGKENIPHARR